MSLSLFLTLLPAATVAEPMELMRRLAGHTWYTSLAFPDKYEHIVTAYAFKNGVLTGAGRAQSAGEIPIVLKSTFAPSKNAGELTYDDRQGKNHLVGVVTQEGDKIVIRYGAAGQADRSGREELVFKNDHTVEGAAYWQDKLVLNYTMKRVGKPIAELAIQGNDPVMLTKGTKQEGKESISTEFQGFRYTFASPETFKTFQADPEIYAVQFGGACMNMGPLSGRGQTAIYEVYKNRTYLFASEGCRNAFRADPDAYIDRPDKPFAATAGAQQRAVRLLALAAKAHGVDKVKSVLREVNEPYQQSGKTIRYDTTVWSNLVDSFSECQAYSGSAYVTATSPKGSWMGTLHQPAELVDSERDYFVRQNLRDPFALLKNRSAKGFVAEPLGKMDAGDLKGQEGVRTFYKGVTAILFLDPATHRITAMRHRGRLIRENSEVLKVFGDYRKVGSLVVPHQVTSIAPGRNPVVTKYAKIAVDLPASVIPTRPRF